MVLAELSRTTDQQSDQSTDSASLYRTRWLMAHNRLHALFHSRELIKSQEHRGEWEAYLTELRTAEEVASRPA
jgi:Zn-dependent peptidase ImmA (M78 family)